MNVPDRFDWCAPLPAPRKFREFIPFYDFWPHVTIHSFN
jgi:hypothetical protein